MSYTFKEIPETEIVHHVFINEQDYKVHEIDDLRCMPQYEILDPQGDPIITVHSKLDAVTLLSHLNGGR